MLVWNRAEMSRSGRVGMNSKCPNGEQESGGATTSDQHGGKARCSGTSVNWIQFADESLGVAWSE
jgi:hypothetical protein